MASDKHMGVLAQLRKLLADLLHFSPCSKSFTENGAEGGQGVMGSVGSEEWRIFLNSCNGLEMTMRL